MKISRLLLKEIANDAKLTKKQINIIENKYCISEFQLKNLVLYSYDIQMRRGEDQQGKGTITKEQYQILKDEYKKDPERTYYNAEITKHCYLSILFDEIEFTEDIDLIDEFLSSDLEDKNIFEDFFEE